MKANGNFDGRYYGKGRAGQAIGESARAAGRSAPSSSLPAPMPRRSSGGMSGAASDLSEVFAMMSNMQSARESHETGPSAGEVVIGNVVEDGGGTVAPPAGQVHDVEPSGVLSFAFLTELESRHLRSFQSEQSEHSSHWGDELRRETQAWAELKVTWAKKLADGHASLVEVLERRLLDLFRPR